MASIEGFARSGVWVISGAAFLLAPVGVSAKKAAAKPQAPLTYFLPKTSLSATVSHRLASCPDGDAVPKDADAEVATIWELKAATSPDYSNAVKIDAAPGFLVKRNIEMTMTADGVLTGFNSVNEGQGGAVVKSLIGLAKAAVPLFLLSESDTKPNPCSASARRLLISLAATQSSIAAAQDQVARGTASAVQIAVLEELKQRKAALLDQLTVEVGEAKFEPQPPADASVPSGHKLIPASPASAYKDWFTTSPENVEFPGSKYGFLVEWAAVKDAYEALGKDGAEWTKGSAQRKLVFRRPVQSAMAAAPCANTAANDTCITDKTPEGKAASGSFKAAVPQLGAYVAIPTDGGGIFGARTVKATFDATGAPLTLSYGSDPGAAGVAGVIDSGAELVTAVDGAELSKLKRELDLMDARQKICAARGGTYSGANDTCTKPPS